MNDEEFNKLKPEEQAQVLAAAKAERVKGKEAAFARYQKSGLLKKGETLEQFEARASESK